jgi:hypothetical protein
MKDTVTLGVRKLFFLIVALYAGYCAFCWLIPSARLGNITPAGTTFAIFITNFIGCLTLTVLNLLEIGLLTLGFIFGIGMVLHSRAKDYRKGGELAELGQLKYTEAVIELLVGAFIVYLFYMEFVEPPEALMPPVWERLWETVRGCVPS